MKRKTSKSSPPQQPPQRPYLHGCITKSKSKLVAAPPPQQPAQLRSCSSCNTGPEVDILSAKRCGKQYLIHGNGEQVHVDTLRGKLIGLFLVRSESVVYGLQPFIDLYNQLRESNISDFEIVYVVIPPSHPSFFDRATDLVQSCLDHYNLSFFTHFISTLPWLSIPFEDEDWRTHLVDLYTTRNSLHIQLTIIDQYGQLVRKCALSSILTYGPRAYPFTRAIKRQLRNEFNRLHMQISVNALLTSTANGGFLIDHNFNKVPVSQLEGKHVALYNPNGRSPDSDAFFYQLVDIYNQTSRDDFEIVFINFQYGGIGYDDKESFDDAVKEMPWLSLPFRDDNCWSLCHLLYVDGPFLRIGEWYDYPALFIRAKGESFLDPYGYHVIKRYGVQAYPFTRRAALRFERRRLKEKLTFESFMKRAAFLGFSSLVRNKNNGDGEVEEVSLSDLNLKESPRGMIFLFASLRTLKKEVLNSLIDSYNKQKWPFSFEVIFVSVDKDNQSFLAHFSAMPWFAFHKQLEKKEYEKLIKRTTKIDFFDYGHFIAFGPTGNFLRMGDLWKSFDGRKFPFARDYEFINFLTVSMNNFIWPGDETFGREEHMDWLGD